MYVEMYSKISAKSLGRQNGKRNEKVKYFLRKFHIMNLWLFPKQQNSNKIQDFRSTNS